MKKLSVFNHVTIDGLFAGSNGEIDWFQTVHDDEWKRYAQKHADLSRHTLMFGHTTYAMMKSWWPTLVAMHMDPAMTEVMNNSPKVVFSQIQLTIYSPVYLEAHPELIQAELQALPVPEHAVRLHLQAAKEHDAWDLLPTIQAPTLVMHGSDDQRLPTANAYLLAGRIPGAELSIIQGRRHGFMVEKRSEASRVVNEFLARHPL